MSEIINLFGEDVLTQEKSRAVLLHQDIIYNLEKAADHLHKTCCQIKEMRDTKLYLELGYKDFDQYVEEAVGIKRRQAYDYIKVVEKLPEEFVQANAKIGITKLQLLAGISPMERDEFIENNQPEK